MAIELGAAYISILPATDKLASGIKASLKDAQGEALNAGKKIGDDLDQGASKGIGSLKENLVKNLKAGAALAGAAAGAIIAKSIVDAMGQEAGSDKMAAALGLNPAQAKKAGKAAGLLYKNGFGESVSDTQDMVKSIIGNMPQLKTAS
jgi:hypothetical protein